MLVWQTARTSQQARPAVSPPRARASGLADLEIALDIRERCPFTFADRQATTRRERLKAGDYGPLVDGLLHATVERKSLVDLVTSLTTGKLTFHSPNWLGFRAPRSSSKRATRRTSRSTASGPASWPTGSPNARSGSRPFRSPSARPRKLAQEWTYRFLAAAQVGLLEEMVGDLAVRDLEAVGARWPEGSDWARFDPQPPATAFCRGHGETATSSQVSGQFGPMWAAGRTRIALTLRPHRPVPDDPPRRGDRQVRGGPCGGPWQSTLTSCILISR